MTYLASTDLCGRRHETEAEQLRGLDGGGVAAKSGDANDSIAICDYVSMRSRRKIERYVTILMMSCRTS